MIILSLSAALILVLRGCEGEENIVEKASQGDLINSYGFPAFDPDPDDWPRIYLLEVSEQ
ncbi:MAG: hypothetical protein KAH54_02380 [Candidatus Sabulitectum sp.]|nr:hypothetical protein [Candidatus Sabulitectum sp.]